jgi:hypothetical protein
LDELPCNYAVAAVHGRLAFGQLPPIDGPASGDKGGDKLYHLVFVLIPSPLFVRAECDQLKLVQ